MKDKLQVIDINVFTNAILIKSFLKISVPNSGACMGKVPSPTNRFGCFLTVSAKSLFMNLDKSKVSSGFALQAEDIKT